MARDNRRRRGGGWFHLNRTRQYHMRFCKIARKCKGCTVQIVHSGVCCPTPNASRLICPQVPEYRPVVIGVGPGETPFNQLAVSTTDTVRMSFIMNKLVRKGRFMMLVGTAGTGKTSIIKEYLRRCDGWCRRCQIYHIMSVAPRRPPTARVVPCNSPTVVGGDYLPITLGANISLHDVETGDFGHCQYSSYSRATTLLGSLDKDADGLLDININMNYFTDSATLQQVRDLERNSKSTLNNRRRSLHREDKALNVALGTLYHAL